MPYLTASDLPTESAGRRFRTLLNRPEILRLPGAHNGMAALQARAAGFEALYLSGAAMTASMGLPDLGVITVDEVAFFVRQIVRASGLPLLVDGDTGYGEALNVMHMGSHLRGRRCRCGASRGSVAAQEVRTPQRQETRRRSRYGRESSGRGKSTPRPGYHRPHRRGFKRGAGRRGRSCEALYGGWR